MYVTIVKILEGIKAKVIQQYNQKGIKASGSFERNIKIGRQGRTKVLLSMPFHSRFIISFRGNKPGRGPGPVKMGIIEQWIKDKGFPLRDYLTGQFIPKTETNIKKIAYLIRRKIGASGTRIYNNKAQPIDIDVIVKNEFDYRGEELANRIVQMIKI